MTMCRVVGNDRTFCLCIGLLQRTDFILFHINGTKYKVYLLGNGIDICRCVINLHRFHGFRDGRIHCPAAAYGFFIRFAGAARRSCQYLKRKPRVVFHQGDKPLSHHTGCADNTHIILFHKSFLLVVPDTIFMHTLLIQNYMRSFRICQMFFGQNYLNL